MQIFKLDLNFDVNIIWIWILKKFKLILLKKNGFESKI